MHPVYGKGLNIFLIKMNIIIRKNILDLVEIRKYQDKSCDAIIGAEVKAPQ